MGKKSKAQACILMQKTIAVFLGFCLIFLFMPSGMETYSAGVPVVVFDNYREVSTYIETCEAGDTYTLTARLMTDGVEDDTVTWNWTWATPSQSIGKFVSTDGNSATIEALAVGNTKITATASKDGTTVASAQAILNVVKKSNYDEPWRPQFHFSQNTNWSNDPNGMVYYDGEWHLFFQYNPYGNSHGNMSWGHAVSTDLVYWEELDVALYPDNATYGQTAQPGFDNLGQIFSGSAVVDENNTTGFFTDTPEKKGLVAIYTNSASGTGTYRQQQSIAYSTDRGRTWTKYEGNPVISSYTGWEPQGSREGDPGDPLSNRDFRDPKVFWHAESEQWIMIVAGGPIRFYSSPNLISWKAEAMQREITTECPDFFELEIDETGETKWILSEGGRYYRVGEFKLFEEGDYAGKWGFVTDSDPNTTSGIARYNMNYAPDAYAAQTYSDGPDGRRVLIQWMTTWDYANAEFPRILKPYNGQFTLNEELSLTKIGDGSIRLQQTPVEEYESLRTSSKTFTDVTVTPTNNVMSSLSGDMFEIKAEFTPDPDTTEVGFKLRVGGGYETVVKYDIENQRVYTDRTNSGPKTLLIDGVQVSLPSGTKFFNAYNANVAMEDGKIDLHIFVDKCSVEVYAGRYTEVGTSLIIPHQTESGNGIEVYSAGGNAKANIEFYRLSSIWHDNSSVVDKYALDKLISEAEELDSENYTGESWAQFMKALDEAKRVSADENATQAEVDDAAEALWGAMDALEDFIGVQSVKIDGAAIQQLRIRNTKQFTATVNPTNATDQLVTWESSNPKIFTVEDGLVKGVGTGSAKLIVTCGDKTSFIMVQVTA